MVGLELATIQSVTLESIYKYTLPWAFGPVELIMQKANKNQKQINASS